MIEISRNSLAYRWMLYGTFFDPKWSHQNNLCPFVRRMILGFVLTLFVYPFLWSLLILALAAPWAHLITSLYFWDSAYFWVSEPLFLIGSVIYAFVFMAIGGFFLFADESPLHRYFIQKYEENVGKPMRKSIIFHYIEAIHNKICPEIDIVD